MMRCYFPLLAVAMQTSQIMRLSQAMMTTSSSVSAYSIQKGAKVPIYLAGKAIQPNTDLPVFNKYNGEEFC